MVNKYYYYYERIKSVFVTAHLKRQRHNLQSTRSNKIKAASQPASRNYLTHVLRNPENQRNKEVIIASSDQDERHLVVGTGVELQATVYIF